MGRTKTAIVQLKVRLREDLRARLEQEAKKAGHSLNQEMVRRLKLSFDSEKVEDVLQEIHFLAADQRVAMQEFIRRLKDGK